MSGVRVEGEMPKLRAVNRALEKATEDAAKNVGDAALPIIRGGAPGGLGKALEAKVQQTRNGHAVSIGPSRRAYKGGASSAEVVRWVTRGTGIYRKGGRKRPITSKRGLRGTMTLPGGIQVRSVKGQRSNPFVAEKGNRATAAAVNAAHDGASDIAARIRRL